MIIFCNDKFLDNLKMLCNKRQFNNETCVITPSNRIVSSIDDFG